MVQAEGSSPGGDTYQTFFSAMIFVSILFGLMDFSDRLGSNWRTLLVQHDVTVDHTMLSGVAKLSKLRSSTMSQVN